jgi:hypothetical protein
MIKQKYNKLIKQIKLLIKEIKVRYSINRKAVLILRKIIPMFKKRYIDCLNITDNPSNRINTCTQVLFRKCVDLLHGLSLSAHKHCALSSAMNARALLETTIHFVNFYYQVEKAIKSKSLLQLHEEIRVYLFNTRNDEHLYSNTKQILGSLIKSDANKEEFYKLIKKIEKSKGDEKKQMELLNKIDEYFISEANIENIKSYIIDFLIRYRTTNILTEINNLEKHYPSTNVKNDYEKISEFCHHSFDSMLGLFVIESDKKVYFESNKKKLNAVQFALEITGQYMKIFINKYNDLCNLMPEIVSLEKNPPN